MEVPVLLFCCWPWRKCGVGRANPFSTPFEIYVTSGTHNPHTLKSEQSEILRRSRVAMHLKNLKTQKRLDMRDICKPFFNKFRSRVEWVSFWEDGILWMDRYLEVSWVIGVPPDIIHFSGIFHERNHPAMGYPHWWKPPFPVQAVNSHPKRCWGFPSIWGYPNSWSWMVSGEIPIYFRDGGSIWFQETTMWTMSFQPTVKAVTSIFLEDHSPVSGADAASAVIQFHRRSFQLSTADDAFDRASIGRFYGWSDRL